MTRQERRPGVEAGPNDKHAGALLSVSHYSRDTSQRQLPPTIPTNDGTPTTWAIADAIHTLARELAADGLLRYENPQVRRCMWRAWQAMGTATYLTAGDLVVWGVGDG
jgi:hypothetical protein